MNDETKDELMKRTREWLQSCVNAATRSGVPEEADLEAFILAHIDGEPERLAAARREAAEEKAEEGVRYWTDLAQAEARDAAALRTRVAELERALADAVAIAREFDARQQKAEARVAELEAERDEAVAALRGLLRKEWYIYEGNLEAAGHASVDDLNAARAVLAKYPEGR